MQVKCNKCGILKDRTQFYDIAKGKKCKECHKLYQRERYGGLTQVRSGQMIANRKRQVLTYGITWEQFVAMWDEQDGKCKICRIEVQTFAQHSSSAGCIDHDHSTGQIRGILCRRCNLGIGYFRDKPVLLQAAIVYLQEGSNAHTTER